MAPGRASNPMASHDILILIPARMAATRLPGKPLADIGGEPMIVHVIRRAQEARLGPVIVATDDEVIFAAVEKAGVRALMTRADHPSGSDRIFEALTAMRDRMTDKAANAEADRRFHLGIAQSTGNSVLLATVTSMWDQAQGPVWEKIEQHFHTQALRQASQADHQRIFGALVARDAPGARQAMRDHLERVIGEFAQGWR